VVGRSIAHQAKQGALGEVFICHDDYMRRSFERYGHVADRVRAERVLVNHTFDGHGEYMFRVMRYFRGTRS